MKKLLFIPAILLLCHLSSQAQIGFDQTASGQSAILFRGSNIGLNISDASLGFGINNLDRQLGKEKATILGGAASAKNAEGLGGIFSTGDFVAESKMEGFLGRSFSNAQKIIVMVKYTEAIFDTFINRESRASETKILNEFKSIVTTSADAITDSIKRQKFIDTTINRFKRNQRQVKYISSLASDNQEEMMAIAGIKTEVKLLQDAHDKIMDSLKAAKVIERNKVYDTARYQNLNLFVLGGIGGSDFKRFIGLDSVDYGKSFKDEHFRSGYFGAGVNLQVGNFYFGTTYSYRVTNNFDLLTKKEYTWKQVNTSGNQSLTQEKKIVAYADAYSEVEINDLAIDFAYNFRLDTAADYHLIINPYLRGIMSSRNSTLLPDKLTIGTGAYFFDKTAKFLGGIYVELADVANNYEKLKPLDEQNLRKPSKRISFGITAKFSFRTLRNTFRMTEESKK